MALTRLTILIGVVAACALTACDCRKPLATSPPASQPAIGVPGLSAALTDGQIIGAFGLDPGAAKQEFVQGKDGTSISYTAGDQKVTVTRSLVSGVTVMASGPRSRVWLLGQP
jgi:hypothetical protein